MLNYTTGKQKDGNISYFILLDSVKKQVFAAIEEAKNRKLLLSHFNVFKAYMIENVLQKEMKIKKKKIVDKRRLDILMYMISNEDFYKEVIEKYCDKIKPSPSTKISTIEENELSYTLSNLKLQFNPKASKIAKERKNTFFNKNKAKAQNQELNQTLTSILATREDTRLMVMIKKSPFVDKRKTVHEARENSETSQSEENSEDEKESIVFKRRGIIQQNQLPPQIFNIQEEMLATEIKSPSRRSPKIENAKLLIPQNVLRQIYENSKNSKGKCESYYIHRPKKSGMKSPKIREILNSKIKFEYVKRNPDRAFSIRCNSNLCKSKISQFRGKSRFMSPDRLLFHKDTRLFSPLRNYQDLRENKSFLSIN